MDEQDVPTAGQELDNFRYATDSAFREQVDADRAKHQESTTGAQKIEDIGENEFNQAFATDDEFEALEKEGKIDPEFEKQLAESDKKLDEQNQSRAWEENHPGWQSYSEGVEILMRPDHLGEMDDDSPFTRSDYYELARMESLAKEHDDADVANLYDDIYDCMTRFEMHFADALQAVQNHGISKPKKAPRVADYDFETETPRRKVK